MEGRDDWVEAASVFDPTQLLAAVAQAARVTLAGAPSADKIAVALQSHSMLLVIDNCEHLLEGARTLVQALRREAPLVHILLASQAALRIQGGQIFTLQPLALPRVTDAPDERFGALQLFAERARAVDRRFVLDASNGPLVADICRQLDGLPLAIELAAARVNLLGVQGLRDRLSDRLQLLTTGSHDVPQRHQTLRAALEWSHSLLGPAEQAVLRRLGVFVGGFTLELAQQVAADDASGSLDSWAVLDALGTLVDRSLVSVDAGEPVRYRLLETMRVFALEQLASAGDTAALRARHARAVANLFATVDESRFGDNGKASASEVTQRLQQRDRQCARRTRLGHWSRRLGDRHYPGRCSRSALLTTWSDRGVASEAQRDACSSRSRTSECSGQSPVATRQFRHSRGHEPRGTAARKTGGSRARSGCGFQAAIADCARRVRFHAGAPRGYRRNGAGHRGTAIA